MTTPCPDENTFLALSQGQLDEAERAALEVHIDACPDCAALFIALGQLAAPDSLSTPAPAPRHAGRQIGRYELRRILGSGGMGVVWEAHDPQLHRRVAIKLLRPDLSDAPHRQARLLQEARALAALSHPHILTVYDAGEQEGQVWLAMELVAGQPMSMWARQQREWRRVLSAYLDVARGLAYAHRSGVIHRDVKPDNILVCDSGRAVLTDLGLASPPPAVSSTPAPAPERLTVTGAVMGTPLYMAPEALSGAQADAASDQYSLCAALYEGLYGARPYSAQTLDQLAREISAGQLTRPRSREIPPALFEVIKRGLSPRPAERYASVDALIAALEAASQPPRRWLARAASALGLLAAATALIWSVARAPEQAALPPDPATITAPTQAPAPPARPSIERAVEPASSAIHAASALAASAQPAAALQPPKRAPAPQRTTTPQRAPQPVVIKQAAPTHIQHGAGFTEAERQRAAAITESLRREWVIDCGATPRGAAECARAERRLREAMGDKSAEVYMADLRAASANPESLRVMGALILVFLQDASRRAAEQGRCDQALALRLESLRVWAFNSPSAFAVKTARDIDGARRLFERDHPGCAP